MLIGYLPITPYVNLCKLSLHIKGRNIFENNQLCFGNWWGKFIKVFIEWTLILFTPVGFTPSVIKNCKSNLCNYIFEDLVCVNLSILAKFTQTRSRKIYLNKLDLNRAFLLEILRENVVGKCCRKILWENVAGKCCGKMLWKILWENLAGNSEGNAAGNAVGKSCGKFWGKCCREFCAKSWGKSCRKFSEPIPKPILKPIVKICKSSRSTSFWLVQVKYSFLKPILNGFLHMNHQIKA